MWSLFGYTFLHASPVDSYQLIEICLRWCRVPVGSLIWGSTHPFPRGFGGTCPYRVDKACKQSVGWARLGCPRSVLLFAHTLLRYSTLPSDHRPGSWISVWMADSDCKICRPVLDDVYLLTRLASQPAPPWMLHLVATWCARESSGSCYGSGNLPQRALLFASPV